MNLFNLELFTLNCIALMAFGALANVVLLGNNITVSFDDIEANFAPAVQGSGNCGMLHRAEPIDACSPLTNKASVSQIEDACSSPFVLIIRGGCSFEDKIRRAQSAWFKAAIVYDNEDGGVLVAMAGNSAGIKIPAVFVSKVAGEVFSKYSGLSSMELWIIPNFENSAWSIMAISFISLLGMSAVLATCFFVRRHRIRREHPRASRVQEFRGMNRRLVKAMPSLIFTSVLEDNCTSTTCAICLEDYNVGEKLRILPCSHKFHALCVDSWLTSWRTFCPICKRDAHTISGDPPASEHTPLLSFVPASATSSSASSSIPSPFASSPAIQIARAISRSPSGSRILSHRSSYYQSSSLITGQSSVDLRNSYSQRSHVSHLTSQHSLGYNLSLGNAYLSYVGCSSQQHHPLHCSDSAASFSPFDSAQSLPGC